MPQDPNQPPQPQWDAQQGQWVLPGQAQPPYPGQQQSYGQQGSYGYGQPRGGAQGQPYGQPSGQWPPQAPQAPQRRRKWPWIVGAVVVLFIVVGIANGGNSGAPSPAGSPTATGCLRFSR
jgi:hypothetical protein